MCESEISCHGTQYSFEQFVKMLVAYKIKFVSEVSVHNMTMTNYFGYSNYTS